MRPKITTSKSIARSLQYNENKVMQGKAECLAAANFLQAPPHLSMEDKLHGFKKRMALNERVSTSLHITLNFDPSDTLSNEQMKKIAGVYMKEIGFEKQPYLVYRHHDAGHPHCHIVTTHVTKNGDPIKLFNIGRNQSEKARQLIEAGFGLVTAERKKEARQHQKKPDGIPMITYGKASLTQSLSNILEHVTEEYKYTSLKELNTVLRLYNVEAWRGKETSRLYQNRGLLYRVLDQRGKYIGVPMKASFFDCKPTLDNLEKKFILNQSLKQPGRSRVEDYVRVQLMLNPDNLEELVRGLAQRHIRPVLQRDKQGTIQEVTYIDHQTRCVFSSAELEKCASPQALQQVMDRQKTREAERALRLSREQRLGLSYGMGG